MANACKQDYLEEVYKWGFMMDDIRLYLDTHPEDRGAMEAYRDARNSYKSAMANYTTNVGPLYAQMYTPEGKWKWNSSPMPWEGEI